MLQSAPVIVQQISLARIQNTLYKYDKTIIHEVIKTKDQMFTISSTLVIYRFIGSITFVLWYGFGQLCHDVEMW